MAKGMTRNGFIATLFAPLLAMLTLKEESVVLHETENGIRTGNYVKIFRDHYEEYDSSGNLIDSKKSDLDLYNYVKLLNS